MSILQSSLLVIFPKELTHGLSWKIKIDLSLFLVYIFWPKAWVNPFGKMRFFGTLKDYIFYGQKKVSFLSRTLFNITSGLILTEKNSRKKNTYFDQKHRLTPLGKCDFWDLKRLNFLWPKKVSFLSRTLLDIISSLILTKNNSRKKKHFFTKSMG